MTIDILGGDITTDMLEKMEKGEAVDLSTETPLIKSILSSVNKHEKVQALAFESDPNQPNRYAGIYFEKLGLLPDRILKRIAITDDLVAAILNIRANQASRFGEVLENRFSMGFRIEPREGNMMLSKTEEERHNIRKKMKEAQWKLFNCGKVSGLESGEKMNLPTFLYMTARNAVLFGRFATEILYTDNSKTGEKEFHSFRPRDAGTIYKVLPDSTAVDAIRKQAIIELARLKDEKLNPNKFKANDYEWIQMIEGRPVQAFAPEELLVYNCYPSTDIELNGYPITPIDTAISAITTHINITNHNKLYFQNGRAAKGMIVIQSNDVDATALADLKQSFNAVINSVSNCVTGDTSVWTKEFGQISIISALSGQKELPVTIWTGREWEKALLYETGPKLLTRTVLSNGLSIKTSPDHRFWALRDNEEPVWIAQKDLKVGDFILVNKKTPQVFENLPKLNGKEVTAELLEVFGWFTGDGSLGERSLKLYYHHEKEGDIRDRHFQILKSFDIPVELVDESISEQERSRICKKYGFKSCAAIRTRLTVNSKDLADKMSLLGFNKSSSYKNVPGWILTLPNALKQSYLKGLFSADGNNAKRRSPCITICDERTREQVRELLISLGIRTSFSEGRTKIKIIGNKREIIEAKSVLRIKDRDLFFDSIGFLQKHKQPDFKVSNDLGKSDKIPQNVAIVFAKKIKEFADKNLSKADRSYLNEIIRGSDPCTKARLFRYMDKYGIKRPEILTDFNFEQVVESVNLNETVNMYDVSVYNEEHALVTNGILTHNSWRTPVLKVSQEDKIQWQALEGGTKDMEFQYLYDSNCRIVMSAFQVSPDELPGYSHLSKGTNSQALSESNNEFKLEAHRDVGIRPLLAHLQAFLTFKILPLIDPELAEFCVVKFHGLETDSPEKERTAIQESMQLWGTMDSVREKVELTPYGKEFGGDFPLNQQFQQVLDKYMTVGQVLEFYFGVKDASKDPSLAYRRDNFWFQQVQLIQQQQQMEEQKKMAEQQLAAQQQAQQGGQGQSQQGGQEQPQQKQPDQSDDLGNSVDDAIKAMVKSEPVPPEITKKLLDKHSLIVDKIMEAWEKQSEIAIEEIASLVSKNTKK